MSTPIWRQYLEIKRRHAQSIVFFRLGDFYETFEDDARLCARELEITLTSKVLGKDFRVPLAGIPYHAVDGYLAKLVARGYRVAICEQMADPSSVKGLVPREVVRVVTPGTVLDEALLEQGANNYLVAVVSDGDSAGVASIDVSTGEFTTCQLAGVELLDELLRLSPRELLVGGALPPLPPGMVQPLELGGLALDDELATEELLQHFGAGSLAAYGCAEQPLAVCAAAAIVRYLRENQPAVLSQITRLATSDGHDSMQLDPQTVRNLELFESGRRSGREGTLLWAVDRTKTPMGARLLRRRLARPLVRAAAVRERLDLVEWWYDHGPLRSEAVGLLAKVGDLERLVTRVGAAGASAREAGRLKRGLDSAASLSRLLDEAQAPFQPLPDLSALAGIIGDALADEAEADESQGIRTGFSPELDALRAISRDARALLAGIEQRERERSGIRGLKVGYNRVFGYYIEIANAQAGKVPADYQRRQTLTGAERYVTEELKEHESRILSAQEELERLEAELFRALCARISAEADRIRDLAAAVAELDVAVGLAETAAVGGYCRPQVDDGGRLSIQAGRHPVVERMLPAGAFVPNGVDLGRDESQIVVLTGPNMAGKSTYLRQVALITLLAQAGSYVPAASAAIGVVDRIFTRVGAQDDLAGGNSTFMVEMVETAQILNHCTARSLIVFDEVGRGTSTYDGLAIARAVLEYLHNHEHSAARTLFATHFHELTRLAHTFPRVRNFSVAVGEQDGEVVFLRTIVPGGADKSYGIHVAQLAGLPRAVIGRAAEILAELESTVQPPPARRALRDRPLQLTLLDERPALLTELSDLDVDSLTPLDAIRRLYELRERARDGATAPRP